MFRKILVANDGSKGGQTALAAALDLANRLDLSLAMICVEDLPRFPASIDEVAEAVAEEAGVFDKVVASAKALAQAKGVAFEFGTSSPDIRFRASPNSSSAAAMTCSSSATWATRRSTIESSAARPIGWSSLRRARCWL